jgi:hypothetical protein
MAKKVSKYSTMPEPPCKALYTEYKGCLAVRKRWRAWHRSSARAQAASKEVYNVVGPYVEEDGRVMEGCIGTGLSKRAADELARRKLLERSEYLVGYSPRLVEQFRERTRVTTLACGTPTKAEGLDLTWMGGPADMARPGASSSARRVPMLQGLKRKKRPARKR